MNRDRRKRLKPLLKFLLPRKKALELWCDLGAGSGFFSRLLQDKLPNAEIIQFDKKIKKRERGIFIQGDITKLPFRSSTFDGVLCSQVLHYFPAKIRRNIIWRISRILNSKGKFIVIEYEASQSFPWIPYPLPNKKIRKEIIELGQFREENLVKADINYRPKYALYLQKRATVDATKGA